jgi:hypothetical protein
LTCGVEDFGKSMIALRGFSHDGLEAMNVNPAGGDP